MIRVTDRLVRLTLCTAGTTSALGLAIGCQSPTSPQTSATADVLSTSYPIRSGLFDGPIDPTTRRPEHVVSRSPDASVGSASATQAHTVRAGETYYALATVYYGDGREWPRIAAANPHMPPERVRVGERLVIP